MPKFRIIMLALVLVLSSSAALVGRSTLAADLPLPPPAGTKVIHVGATNNTSLTDRQRECASQGGVVTQWHFVINSIDVASHKPASILVTWSDGSSQTVNIGVPTNNAAVGHYTTTFNGGTGKTATDAQAYIYTAWSGQFVLSDVTCVIPKANIKLTKSFQTGPFTTPGQACFTLSGTPAYAGPSTNPQCITANGTVQWNGLVAGAYSVAETTTPAGYLTMTTINFTVAFDCTGQTPPCYAASVTPGTFEIGPRENLLSPGFLQVTKLLGPAPGSTWTGPAITFYVCKTATSVVLTTCSAATPATATLVFPSGGTTPVSSGPLDEAYYTVCEGVPAGYSALASCLGVQVVAGEAATANSLVFTNTPIVLTWCSPGFWKNHEELWQAYLDVLYNTIPNGGNIASNPTIQMVVENPQIYGGPATNYVGDYLSGIFGLNFTPGAWVDNCPLS